MPITDGEWASVQALIEKKVADKGEPFVTDKVIKRDPDQRVIWTKDFGDEPIPVVSFNSFVRTFDSTASGISVRNVMGNAIVPEIGETVLIARELGTRRLPRCLGVIGGNGLVPSEASLSDKPPPMAGGGGGGSVIYEQPNTPAEPVTFGSLWVDTDEQPPMWVSQIPLVSVLPSNPYDGQEIYYQSAAMATDGIVWHLRYRAASLSAYKWEAIGPPEMYVNDAGASLVLGTGWAATACSLTPPLAGDYIIEFGGRIYQINHQSGEATLAAYINGVYQATPRIFSFQGSAGAATTLFAAHQAVAMRAAVTGTRLVQVQGIVSMGTGNAGAVWLKLKPVRVG